MNRYEEAFFKAEGDAYCVYQLKLNDAKLTQHQARRKSAKEKKWQTQI